MSTLTINPGLVTINLSTAQCQKLARACDIASTNHGDENYLELYWLFLALAHASQREEKR